MAATMEPGTAISRSNAMLVAFRERWSAMEPARRHLLMGSLAALLVLSGISVWWSTRTDWRVLFSGMDGRDAATMEQQLSSAGIRYQTTPDGSALQVPAEQLDKARVAISTSGLPQSGRMGFELFDKPNWVGSEFDEKVNYQRALEGELEHTIGTLQSVRSARVHVVLAKQGAFASEDQPAKASAVLKLRRSNLPREQSDAIRNLIASSIEGLLPEAVTLVDADGRMDFTASSASANDREEEIALQNKLTQVLEPLAGAGNVHATVSISYVQGSEEHTDEVYDPQQSAPLSMQRTEQLAQASRPGGVAGTGSNAPAPQPTAQNAAPNGTPAAVAAGPSPTIASTGQTQNSREESTQYAVTRHVTHTAESAGRIRRITAAIVVNDREIRQMNAKALHTAWQHRTADEMKQLQQLAQAAVGYDEKRGDSVVLENLAFSGNNDDAPIAGWSRVMESTTELLRAQPMLPRALATLGGIVLLGMMVLRPITKQTQILLAPVSVRPMLAAKSAEQEIPNEASIRTSAGVSTQHIFDRVTEQIKAEPKNNTRLIGSWIRAGSEEMD
ncbi:flagellar basal-body MS-ring/collar protein FliF [Terriglobus sp. TAA 43]|uniref:flagellar basal-body MS-ring/collar protein FliF n=1 Tax=Terriglobus sp. TAA 43 TaxID=278961 RepID=UPI0006467B30|nr:flagellar basal-body MS-ring/collar protein FliF [Terriglobus sp. TAA 43]